MNDKLDKKEVEQSSKDQMIHETIDNQLNNFRKNTLNEIGHFKVETGEKINEIVESVNELQRNKGGINEEIENDVKELK
jgi:hypothetical protein